MSIIIDNLTVKKSLKPPQYTEEYWRLHCKGTAARDGRNCTVLSLAMLAELSYADAYNIMEKHGRRHGRGIAMQPILSSLMRPTEYSVAAVDLGRIVRRKGSGLTIKTVARWVPRGKYFVFTSGHVATLIEGVLHDWTAGRRHRVCNLYRVKPGRTRTGLTQGAVHPYNGFSY